MRVSLPTGGDASGDPGRESLSDTEYADLRETDLPPAPPPKELLVGKSHIVHVSDGFWGEGYRSWAGPLCSTLMKTTSISHLYGLSSRVTRSTLLSMCLQRV